MGINVDCIEVYTTQSKNGIMMNVGVCVKKNTLGFLEKQLYKES